MKKTIRLCILIFLVYLPTAINAQTDSIKDNIAFRFTEYFKLEREAIHVHLDKSVFLSDEKIWFKGYVLNRRTKTPFLLTTNVFVSLIDEQGNKLEEQLVFSSNGSFSGSMKLNQNYPSGKYYLQFYTNWMNNFTEDESAVYKVTIINTDKPAFPKEKSDYSKINIDFNPEGGNLIYGVNNVIGIQLSDCSGNPISVREGDIIDEQGAVIRKITLNQFGYGKFEIVPSSQHYAARFTIDGNITESPLPFAQQNGVALQVNNYAMAGKTFISLNANQGYLNTLKGKKVFVAVSQDEKLTIFEADFSNGNTEQKIIFTNDNLFYGVNTIWVFDAEMNELASRLIFKFPEEKATIDINQINENGKFTGTTNFLNTNMSISVLPENSMANNPGDFFSATMLEPYLAVKTTNNNRYYFENSSKTKSYEMDLMLLNQKKMKYNWQDIKNRSPKDLHAFDYGLTIKGSINQSISSPENYKVRAFSAFSRVDEYTDIKNNEFFFNFLVVADSSDVSISVYKKSDFSNPLPIKMNATVINANRSFHLPYKPLMPFGCKPETDSIQIDFPLIFEKDIIKLDQVDINAKNKLTRQMSYGNALLKGYKITAQNNGLDVLNFISNNGFDVQKSKGSVNIYGRSRTTINGQRSGPVVYVD